MEPSVEHFGFSISLSLKALASDGAESVPDQEKFLAFLQKNYYVLNEFIRKHFRYFISLTKSELLPDAKGIRCCLTAYSKDGLDELHENVKTSEFSSLLKAWFESKQLLNEVGLQEYPSLSVDVTMAEEDFVLGCKHFDTRRIAALGTAEEEHVDFSEDLHTPENVDTECVIEGDNYEMGRKEIKKTFYLFIPQPILKKDKKFALKLAIKVGDRNQDPMSLNFVNDQNNPSIWVAWANFNIPNTNDIKYKYVLSIKKWASTHYKEERWRDFRMNCNYHRDVFLTDAQSFQELINTEMEGICYHLRTMVTDVSWDTLESFTKQLQVMLQSAIYVNDWKTHTLKKDDKFSKQYVEAINSTSKDIQRYPDPQASIMFCLASLTALRIEHALIIQWLSSDMAKKMLNIYLEEIDNHLMQQQLKAFLPTVLKSAFGENVTWTECLLYIYPFLSPQESVELSEHFVITSGVKFQNIEPILMHLYALWPTHDGTAEVMKQMFQNTLSIPLLIQMEKHVLKNANTNDIQKCIVEDIHQSYLQLLCSSVSYPLDIDGWTFIIDQIKEITGDFITEAVLARRRISPFLPMWVYLLQQDKWKKASVKNDFIKHALESLEEDIYRQKNISDLQEFWKSISQFDSPLDLTDVSEKVRKRLDGFLNGHRVDAEGRETEALERLLLDEFLFSSQANLVRSLGLVAKHREREVRLVFMKVLTRKDTFPEGLQSALLKWFTEEVNTGACGLGSSEKLRRMYSTYVGLLDVTCLSKDTCCFQKVDNYMLEIAKKTDATTLVEHIHHIETMDKKIQNKFEDHLRKILKSKSSFSIPSSFMRHPIVIQSSLRLVPYEAELNTKKIPVFRAIEDPELIVSFDQILHEAKFWFSIATAEGSKSRSLQEHNNMKRVKKLLTLVSVNLDEKTIPVAVASGVIKTMKSSTERLQLFKRVTKNEEVGDTVNKIDKGIALAYDTISCFRNFEAKYINTLCSSLNLKDKNEYSEQLSSIRTNMSTWEVGKVLDKTLLLEQWSEMLENVEQLKKLSGSKVFLRMCRNGLAAKGNEELTVSEVSTFLLRRVFSEFENLLQPLFEGKSITVAEFYDLFDDCTPLKYEFDFIEHHFKKPVVDREMFLNFEQYKEFEEKAGHIEELLDAFGIKATDQGNDEVQNALHFIQKCRQVEDITVSQVSESVQCMKDLKIDEKTEDLLSKVIESKQLMSFLEENVDQDFTYLINAVEEHSESSINAQEIKQLIFVQRFFNPLLQMASRKNEDTPTAKNFLDEFKRNCNEAPCDIGVNIDGCNHHVHSLKSLHANIASREEATKGVIMRIVQKGRFEFHVKSGTCQVTVSYMKNGQQIECSLLKLSDLKSRALLLTNTEPNYDEDDGSNSPYDDDELSLPDGEYNSANPEGVKQALADFIEICGLVQNIIETTAELHRSGHFSYKEYCQEKLQRVDLKSLSENLDRELDSWNISLAEVRQKYSYLNYVYSDQLWTLFDYFKNKENLTQALYILSFINPNVSGHLTTEQENGEHLDTPNAVEQLDFIGKNLQNVFESLPAVHRPLPVVEDGSATKKLIKPGSPFVVPVKPESLTVVSTVFQLYGSITGNFPLSHQLLFCSSSTHWDEIQLFLKRCWLSSVATNLHCLVNVELLPIDIQFDLVEAIEDAIRRHSRFFLCIVCDGTTSHPTLDKFSKMTHKVKPMFGKVVEECLQTQFSDVLTLTSTVPGLGKSEEVCNLANKLKKTRIHFPISGLFKKIQLIKRLQKEDINDQSILHLDVYDVEDPYQLDIFVFELAVLGMVSCGTSRFVLRTKCVCIEIANTLNNHLKDSLFICTSFVKKELKWNDYNDFLVASEVTNPVQVVCHYLQALDDSSLDSRDIAFVGDKSVTPLSSSICQELLRRHLTFDEDMSFAVLNVLLNVFSDQLKKLSTSEYFKQSNLEYMMGRRRTIKRDIVTEMRKSLTEFSRRSVKPCRVNQAAGTDLLKSTSLFSTDCKQMIERVEGMIRWAETNHLLVIFNSQDYNTVSPYYRNLHDVPDQVKSLFEGQVRTQMPDFSKKDQVFLQQQLEKIVRTSHKPPQDLPKGYTLTPDNLLKMILIFMRIQAKSPVLIMGETGCGKTSLVTYLAKTTDNVLKTFSIHAGTTEQDILETVNANNDLAKSKPNKQFWMFMDEINTCNHLGLINEIMCHRTYRGKAFASNIFFLAACNPYKPRKDSEVHTPGLEEKVKKDTRSNLVYRVHPLPEALIDYVWDFGSIDTNDERAYMFRMVQKANTDESVLLVELLWSSQKFIREKQGNTHCVSLRDVQRCIDLCIWFATYYFEKKRQFEQGKHCADIQVRSFVLSLSHSYSCRLTKTEDREDYYSVMANIFLEHGKQVTKEAFKEIIKKEQDDLLKRMNLPDNTARNTALRENVFIILVSILKKIPIFVVGKPGSSKSLSLQLIRSNLRGLDSRDLFFKSLPYLYIVSYQGSESSNSEGIEKVFEKAMEYKETNQGVNKADEILPVVLLDEIGLAEQSKSNPLKVLHNLLESADGKLPDIAVVGISNWALDAAKMNRAFHLSRHEPDEDDLFDTAVSIATYKNMTHSLDISKEKESEETTYLPKEELKRLASAYFKYQRDSRFRNFHGLRDYYSLIKYLCQVAKVSGVVEAKQWKKGLLRNFGGLTTGTQATVNQFMPFQHVDQFDTVIHVKDLVQENISDRVARHLMLITNGDSAIEILDTFINLENREHEIIYGSSFEEDLSEDYNYRVLSRIILCMERGVALVLKDLANIYGSLYDMLNQSYTIVGSKKTCRVAHGHYSNPMCTVHEDFRCIVLMEAENVDYSDPPFLNRFEKQILTFEHILHDKQKAVVEMLETWVTKISTVPELNDMFQEDSSIVGHSSDTLSSLVFNTCLRKEEDIFDANTQNQDEILESCKRKLMWIFSPDGILRASRSQLGNENEEEVRHWQMHYFNLPLHNGIRCFLDFALEDLSKDESEWYSDEIGLKIFIHTQTTIVFDIAAALQDRSAQDFLQIEKLNVFKSEKSLTDKICRFWLGNKSLLVIQCTSNDKDHIFLTKSLIEKQRTEYKKRKTGYQKHVLIVSHTKRGTTRLCPLTFLSGWHIVNIDSLEKPMASLPQILGKNMADIIGDRSLFDINGTILENLMWAFSCINYSGDARSTESMLELTEELEHSEITSLMENRIVQWVDQRYREKSDTFSYQSWLVRLACDSFALRNSSTFLAAVTSYLQDKVKEPLAMVVFLLEKGGSWNSFRDDRYRSFWQDTFLNPQLFQIDDLPVYSTAGLYQMNGIRLDLLFPFSRIYLEKLSDAKTKALFVQGCQRSIDNAKDLEWKFKMYEQQQKNISALMFDAIPELQAFVNDKGCDDFMDDICDILTSEHSGVLEKEERVFVARWAINLYQELTDKSPSEQVVQLLTNYWIYSSEVQSIIRLISVCKEILDVDVMNLVCASKENVHRDGGDDVQSTENSDQDTEVEPTNEDTGLDEEDSSSHSSESEKTVHESDVILNLSPHERLVGEACKALLPTKKVLRACKGIGNWQNKVNLILAVASKVTQDLDTLYLLRILNDFAMNLQIPYHLEEQELSDLVEVAANDNYMLESLFEKLFAEHQQIPLLETQNFFCNYLSRCFSVNENSAALALYFERIALKQVIDPELNYFGQLIDSIWAVEAENSEENSDDIVKSILHGENVSTTNTMVGKLGEALIECVNQTDFTLLVLTSDVIEMFVNSQLANVPVDKSDCFLTLAKTALSIFQQEQTWSLKLVVAIGYLKSYLREVALIIKETKNSEFLDEISFMLEERLVRIYFLKCFHEKHSFQETIQLCLTSSSRLPALSTIEWTKSDYMNPIGYKLMSIIPDSDYQSTFEALNNLLRVQNSEQISTYIAEARASATKTQTLLSVLADNVYLVSGHRVLKDTEKTSVKKVLELLESNSFPPSVCSLAECLIKEREFGTPKLDISTSSTASVTQVASVITSLVILVISSDVIFGDNQNSSLFSKAILCPRSLQDLYIPSIHELASAREPNSDVLLHACSSMHRLATKGDVCSICKSTLNHKSTDGSRKDIQPVNTAPSTGISFKSPPLIQPRHMSDASFFIFRLFLNSCLLSGQVIMKTTTMADVLNMDDKALSHEEALQCCEHEISLMWNSLRRLLNLPSHQMCCFLHGLIHRLHNVLSEATVDNFRSKEQRVLWEGMFTKEVDAIVQRRHDITQKVMRNASFDRDSIEYEIDELGDKFIDKGREVCFRFIPLKSYQHLRGSFNMANLHERHPFLGDFFLDEKRLSLLEFIEPLLHWQKLMTRYKSHHILRKRRDRFVSTVIHDDQMDPAEEEELKSALENFISAWNKVQDLTEKHSIQFCKMSTLSGKSPLQKCVAFTKDSMPYKVIECLVEIHNSFLDKVLQTAVTGNSVALSFLRRDESLAIVPITPLQEASSRQIIKCPEECDWSRYLTISQNNTAYGMGQDVQFDFPVIEMELCNKMLFGKCHLLIDNGFPFFSYAHELPPNSMLIQFERIVEKQALPLDAKKTLKNLNSNQEDMLALIKHLNLLLYMIIPRPRRAEEKPETLITEYLNDICFAPRARSFPHSLFPQPLDSLNLHHFVSLYEMTEELLCHNAEHDLPGKFRKSMSDENMKAFESRLKKTPTEIDLFLVVKMVRRFIYRYFSQDLKLDESAPLFGLLEVQQSETPEGDAFFDHVKHIFDDDVQVCHVYQTVKLTEEAMKEKAKKSKPVEIKINLQRRAVPGRRRHNKRDT